MMPIKNLFICDANAWSLSQTFTQSLHSILLKLSNFLIISKCLCYFILTLVLTNRYVHSMKQTVSPFAFTAEIRFSDFLCSSTSTKSLLMGCPHFFLHYNQASYISIYEMLTCLYCSLDIKNGS